MSILEITLAGEPVCLLPQRAAHLRHSATLLVSDLHLGRQDSWRASGMPIGERTPSASLEEVIARLDALVLATRARRILVLGDLLHAPSGLTAEMIERFARWRRDVPIPFQLVPGNHDRRLDAVVRAWDLEVLPPLVHEGPFGFTHDATTLERTGGRSGSAVLWCGHVHPMVRLSTRGDSVRLPCFWIGAGMALLPAFSGMSSGATVRAVEGDRVFAIAGDDVLDISRAAATPVVRTGTSSRLRR